MSNADTTLPAETVAEGQLATLTDEERLEVEQSLTRLNWLAELMDDKFELPIVRYRIGLDPIIGVIPGGGDWVTWVVSVYIFWEAVKIGVSNGVLLRMASNVIIDLLVGYIPALGDVFDATFKANRKNVDMLLDHFGATGDREAHLPDDIPVEAVESHRKSRVGRFFLGLAIVLVLLGLAAVPFVVLWWTLHES